MALITRRGMLIGGAAGSGLLLAGCDKILQGDHLNGSASFQRVLAAAQGWTLSSQRFLLGGGALAREFKPSDISRHFKANGTSHPGGEDYARHLEEGFANWRLRVDGMVARPLSLSVDEIRRLPARTQITRHDCVEGWSAIGQWTGAPLGPILKAAGVAPGAKYAIFYCADNLEGEPAKGGQQSPGQYYESLALVDCFHPQTLIAYDMNGAPLGVPYGAPLRLRVERQLGYKHAKYVQRIRITDTLAGVSGGKGGYWEDRGYEWYAGI
ncbi:molybdopterin-dependent oxidoreductase [Caulobacter sp. S45]|jgi:DMSO/TMAO reductase YedYZ molybdopterin-dependent catalytic subunit|uniref:molybdopterin-dependent oxidoreductase n=1 Tax=Caulobacter sp. S45 TaxID=1641861 RepID=UPI001C205CA4|nr:molybdopterin-dependent oxidoreductase [Caulobacter sp. S45]